MTPEGIYVEISIKASIDDLWMHSQEPALHEQWDLRFTQIDYLPKSSEDAPQRFLYTTAIGFGLQIAGEGESVGTRHTATGESTSALKFWSDAPLSLIKTGSGYWKYIPQGDSIRFLTWYDYQVRFGLLGRIFDRFAFRPLLGWATAWSFDTLRLWLEKGLPPAQSTQRFLTHVIVQVTLASLWIYQGLVPKLLFPDSGELEILRGAGVFNGFEPVILATVGTGEILFGLLFLLPRFRAWLHVLNLIGLLFLGIGGWISQPPLFVAPFNPVTLTLAMSALSLIAIVNRQYIPYASNCLRKPVEGNQ